MQIEAIEENNIRIELNYDISITISSSNILEEVQVSDKDNNIYRLEKTTTGLRLVRVIFE